MESSTSYDIFRCALLGSTTEYREAARLVFSGQIREWTRRHRKSTDEPNDFSHKPKTTLRVRGYLLRFRRALAGSRAPVGKKVPTT